jgi:hypothetical protein
VAELCDVHGLEGFRDGWDRLRGRLRQILGLRQILRGHSDRRVGVRPLVRVHCSRAGEDHCRGCRLALGEWELDAGAFADLAVSELAAVAAEECQQQHSEDAGGG